MNVSECDAFCWEEREAIPLSTPTNGCTLNICPLKGSAAQLSVISRNGFTIENSRADMSSGLWLISLYDTLYEYCLPELKDVPLTFNLIVHLSNSVRIPFVHVERKPIFLPLVLFRTSMEILLS